MPGLDNDPIDLKCSIRETGAAIKETVPYLLESCRSGLCVCVCVCVCVCARVCVRVVCVLPTPAAVECERG
jgi:hypothetical protein